MSPRHVGRHRPAEGPQGPRWHRRVTGSALTILALSSVPPAVAARSEVSTDTDVIPVIPPTPTTNPRSAVATIADAVLTQAEAQLLHADALAKTAKAAEAARARAKARAKVAAVARAHRYTSPLWADYAITSGYGMRWGKLHPAIDLGVPTGTKVHALTSGRVIFAGWSSEGYGYMVLLRHWDGAVSRYAHNSRLLVSVGDYVSTAQVLSYSGDTGNSSGPHLHLEVWPNGHDPVPPRQWLAAKGVRI